MTKNFTIILLLFAFSCADNSANKDPLFEKINNEVLENSRAYEDLKEETSVIGHRLTGSDNGHKVEQFVYDKFIKYGFEDVKFQEFEVDAWSRGTLSVSIIANGKKADVPAVSLGHSPTEANVEAIIIDMGNGLIEDYTNIGENLKDKLALIYIGILPNSTEGQKNLHRSEKAKLAIDHGASGIIIINQVPNGVLLTGTASVSGELLTAPAVCIGYEDGLTIKEMLATESGSVTAQINMTNYSGPIKARNVIATIKGSSLPDDEVIIGGHLDSWDLATGAIDNGIGSFAVLDIARTFIANDLKPARTTKFVLFMGEEQGLLGSRNYIKQALDSKEIDKIKLMMNMDMTGNPVGINVAGKSIDTAFFNNLNYKINEIDTIYHAKFSTRAGLHSDHQPFILEGIPVVSMHSNLDRSIYRCYHADCDDFNLVNPEHIKNTTRFGTMAFYSLANAEKLPAVQMSSDETRQFMISHNLEENLKMQGDWKWE
jgi:Iap family predicted aminopeptidase